MVIYILGTLFLGEVIRPGIMENNVTKSANAMGRMANSHTQNAKRTIYALRNNIIVVRACCDDDDADDVDDDGRACLFVLCARAPSSSSSSSCGLGRYGVKMRLRASLRSERFCSFIKRFDVRMSRWCTRSVHVLC